MRRLRRLMMGEQVWQIVDEALDLVRHGEDDDYAPFEPIDNETVETLGHFLSEVAQLKRAVGLVEKWAKRRIEEQLGDDNAVRFGNLVYAVKPKPKSWRPGPNFVRWAQGDLPILASFNVRKTEVRRIAKERGETLQALFDSDIVNPGSDGDPELQIIDTTKRYAPMWAQRLPDEWTNE